MGRFDHERLEVYRAAVDLMAGVHGTIGAISRERWPIADQLLRAATSIPLNIAEGAGEHSRKDKARFYRIARRSAAECAAILDVLQAMNNVSPAKAIEQKELLGRIAAMLTRMVQSLEGVIGRRPGIPSPSPSPSPSPNEK